MSRPVPTRPIAVVYSLLLVLSGCAEDSSDPFVNERSNLEVLVTLDGAPVFDMSVTIKPWDTAIPFEGVPTIHTGSSGVVRYGFIHPGTYTLEFEHDEVACASQIVKVPPRTEAQHHVACSRITAAMLLFPGIFEFDQDTVWMAVGDRLHLVSGQPTREPGPGEVFATYRRTFPRVVRCTDVPVNIKVSPLPCPMVAAHHMVNRPDTAIIIDDSMMLAVARVLPCVDPANWSGGGGFGECATWGATVTEAGPGMEVISAGAVDAVGCGRSWVSKTGLDGWRRPWPEPLAGVARIEVVIDC